jgi:hypothetical protein
MVRISSIGIIAITVTAVFLNVFVMASPIEPLTSTPSSTSSSPSLRGSGPKDGCCWAKDGDKYRFNTLYLNSGAPNRDAIRHVYTQWDTSSGTYILSFMRRRRRCFIAPYIIVIIVLPSSARSSCM